MRVAGCAFSLSTHPHTRTHGQTDIQMARRCSGEHLAVRTGNAGKKTLRRSMTMTPGEIYQGVEDGTCSKLGDKVLIRRRLSKAESMAVETSHIEKTPTKTWKRLLRKQRTMGEIDVTHKPSKGTFRGWMSRLDRCNRKEAKLTRNPSIGNSYPDLTTLHLSQSVSTSETKSCNVSVGMEVNGEQDTRMDTTERIRADEIRTHDRSNIHSLQHRSTSDYQRRIENIFLVDKHSAGSGMQLRSGNVIQKSKFDVNENFHTRLAQSNSLQSSSQAYSKILDFLYLGSIESAYNEPLLCKLKIHVLVDLSNVPVSQVPAGKKSNCPCPCKKESHFRSRLNVGVDDIEWENVSQHFNDINNFIEGGRKSNKNVLVFSYHGKSRAAAAVVQYIMRHFRLSLDDAFNLVQSRRPVVAINSGFWRALQRLEKELARDSVLPFRNQKNDNQLGLGPPQIRHAWPESNS